MIRNLYVISEGRSECDFVKNVLSEHLIEYMWIVIPLTLPTSRGTGSGRKGGWRRTKGYEYAIKGISNMIITHSNEVHTTFFDLYGFPSDIPCYEQAKALSSPLEKARLYEDQLKKDVNGSFASGTKYNLDLFIPYVQPYEFECFLFVDPECSAQELSNGEESKAELLEKEIKKIKNNNTTPEHINDDPKTAPSKRIESLVPGFVKNKTGKAGFSWRIPQRIGTERLRAECNHFNEWLSFIESYTK